MGSTDEERYFEPGAGAVLCDALCFRPKAENALMYRPTNGKDDFESNPRAAAYQQPAFGEMLCKVVVICSVINMVVEAVMLTYQDCVHMSLTVPDTRYCANHTVIGDLFITVSNAVPCAPAPPGSPHASP
eukprot:SAG22_NODE_7875_length_701_cov_0.671096_1_plen_129_part_10